MPNNAHLHLSKGPSLFRVMAWRLFGARPMFWTTDGMLIKRSFQIFGETWNKIKQFYPRYTFRYVMYKTMSIFTGPRCVRRTHLFQYYFYELWLYVRRHIIYCDWWLSWQRLNALMIVSKVYYIAIQKHLLPSVHYSDVNVNICISTE